MKTSPNECMCVDKVSLRSEKLLFVSVVRALDF